MQTPCQQSRVSSPVRAVPQYLAPHGGSTPARYQPTRDIPPHLLYNVLYIGEQRSTP